jgi:hypothetical protein
MQAICICAARACAARLSVRSCLTGCLISKGGRDYASVRLALRYPQLGTAPYRPPVTKHTGLLALATFFGWRNGSPAKAGR